MGLAVPEGLPGKVSADAWEAGYVQSNPIKTVAGFLPDPPEPQKLTADSNMQLDELRKMGYLPDEGEKKKVKDVKGE